MWRSQLAVSPPWQDIVWLMPTHDVAAIIYGENADEMSATMAVMEKIRRMIRLEYSSASRFDVMRNRLLKSLNLLIFRHSHLQNE